MRKYEIMFIVRPNIEEEAKKQLVESYSEVLTSRQSEIEKIDSLGLRTLAYEIKKFRKGHYFLMNVKAPIEAINEFDRLAKISEDIIRYIIIKNEE